MSVGSDDVTTRLAHMTQAHVVVGGEGAVVWEGKKDEERLSEEEEEEEDEEEEEEEEEAVFICGVNTNEDSPNAHHAPHRSVQDTGAMSA